MQKVQVYKNILDIPTYNLLEDNLNPVFDKALRPYPYTLMDFKSNTKKSKDYEVVVLENEYLKVTVIPSLGGRIHSAVDKRTNKEMFYKNSSIKPRMVATRGAWISGGVEFNFPISHSPTTMDRVNYSLHSYDDGSASVIFGNIEQMSYMNWKVELKLHPGKAYIEQNVRLYNPTSYENRFYFWTNAAIEYTPNLKLIYPFDWCSNFETKYAKWPFAKGINCSNPSELPFVYETFGKLLNDNFFGIYNFDKDFGVIHYADRKIVKGAKFFLWGNDDRAKAWNRALTDDGTEYLEIQSGPFESQRVFKFLKPHQEAEWSEYWYPVSGMDGFRYAEKEVALNYRRVGQGIELSFSAVEVLKDCSIVLKVKEEEYTLHKDLTPDKVETVRFDLKKGYNEGDAFELDVYCGQRHILSFGKRQEFNEDYLDLDLYEDSRTRVTIEDEKKLINWATWLESVGRLDEALETYQLNLERNPGCILTLNRLGRIYLKQQLFTKAKECFKKVLVYDNRNSEARFYFAIALKDGGSLKDARRLLMDISSDSVYYRASVIELVKLDLVFGYYKDAAVLLEKYVNCDSSYVNFLAGICHRKVGLYDKSKTILETTRIKDEFVLAEQFVLKGGKEEKDKLLSFTAGDKKVLLPVAMEYIGINLYTEARVILELIKNPDVESKLLLMYIQQQAGQLTTDSLKSILDGSLDHVFINIRNVARILEENRCNDEEGKIDYLLGNYYYSVGRKDDALDLFLSSYKKGLRYTVLLRNLGYIYYNYKKDPDCAAGYFEEDLLLSGGVNEESIIYLNKIYAAKCNTETRKKLIPFMSNARNRSLILGSLIEILRDTGEEEKALAILENEEFENWEGQEGSGELYKSIIINAAMKEVSKGNIQNAKELIDRANRYPVNINYGDSVNLSLSEVYYHKGIIYSLAGDNAAACEQFKMGVKEISKPDTIHTEKSQKYSIKCLEELKKRI